LLQRATHSLRELLPLAEKYLDPLSLGHGAQAHPSYYKLETARTLLREIDNIVGPVQRATRERVERLRAARRSAPSVLAGVAIGGLIAVAALPAQGVGFAVEHQADRVNRQLQLETMQHHVRRLEPTAHLALRVHNLEQEVRNVRSEVAMVRGELIN